MIKKNTKDSNLEVTKKSFVGKEIDMEQREVNIKKRLSDERLGY